MYYLFSMELFFNSITIAYLILTEEQSALSVCIEVDKLTRFREHRASHVPYLLPGAEETLACQTGSDPESMQTKLY